MEAVLVLQEELGVLISLGGGPAEPIHRLCPILLHTLSNQIQFTQHILSVLVAGLRRFCEPIHRFGSIL